MTHAIQDALSAAGVASVPLHGRQWIADRLRQFGHVPELRNIGGLCCTRPHDHTAGGCIAMPTAGGVRHLAVFRTWDDAARCLVATARRASAAPADPAEDLPAVGYTSTHPVGDETAGPWDTVKEALGPVAELTSLFLNEPSAEAEAVFRGLLADWESFERAGVPGGVPELKLQETHAGWVKFRDAWLRGEPDTTDLNPKVAEANTVRRLLLERAGKLAPGELPPDLRQGVDIEKSRLDVIDKVKGLLRPNAPEGLAQIPLKYKLAAGAAGVALVLYLASGRTTVVQAESPPRDSR